MSNLTLRYFDRFSLDLATGELREDGAVRRLERQPAAVLLFLVRHADRLVSRAELRRHVWGDGTHVDFDLGLNYCLRQIRVALGDDARNPRFVETVPRQGYRFIMPVQAHASRRPPRWRQWAAAAALITFVAWQAVHASGDGESHHRLAASVARTIHDVLF